MTGLGGSGVICINIVLTSSYCLCFIEIIIAAALPSSTSEEPVYHCTVVACAYAANILALRIGQLPCGHCGASGGIGVPQTSVLKTTKPLLNAGGLLCIAMPGKVLASSSIVAPVGA